MENNMFNNQQTFTKSLQQNINILKGIFANDETLIIRLIENKYAANIKYGVVFINDMADKTGINEYILKPLINTDLREVTMDINIINTLIKKVLTSSDISKNNNLEGAITKLLSGETLIFVEGQSEILIVNTKGFKDRAIAEPESEKTIRGSKEGFTENIGTNISLIRKRIMSTDLKFRFMEVGNISKTKICLCYVSGIVSEKILNELIERIKKIDVDEIIYVENLEELIKDAPLSVFKTIGNSERPDVVCGKILEGRVAVVCNGTPFVLTLPFIFEEYFQSADDYANNYLYASVNRLLRMLSFFLGVSVPALYISITNFHQELIPTQLLLSISTAREGLPFPTMVEAFTMLLGFDFLREAGVRLPTPIGQSVSIVGALVLGEAAVSARLVSAPMVIIIALTGISSFLVPKMLGPFIILRNMMLIMSSFLGLYGYVFGVIGVFIYLMSMRSFGVPYMLYTAEIKPENIKDTIIRAPWYAMYLRPKFSGLNILRRGTKRKLNNRGG